MCSAIRSPSHRFPNHQPKYELFMPEERINRKLAAILAADVVGYSRLMGADEASTLTALKRHREAIFDPAVAAYNGRIVKLTTLIHRPWKPGQPGNPNYRASPSEDALRTVPRLRRVPG